MAMIRTIFAFAALALAPGPALAAGEVSLSSNVKVERQALDSSGKPTIKLEEPGVVTPGDKLVFTVLYVNRTKEPASNFVVTNPIPASVAYLGDPSSDAELSVDGGHTWGPLSALKIKAADGTLRPAIAADVTHVRWAFAKPIAPGAEGKLSFRAVVR
jgi:uncharacterized repeat protein (TIGR01451 family)